jgi:hypothetical protein
MNRSSSRVWSAGHIAWGVVALTLVKVVLIFEAQAVIFSGWRTFTRQLRPADKRLLRSINYHFLTPHTCTIHLHQKPMQFLHFYLL